MEFYSGEFLRVKSKVFIILSLFLVSFFQINAFCEEAYNAEETCEFISIVQLIANPDAFNGKKVCVIGYAIIEFEGNAIFLSEESAEHGVFKNSLSLSVNTEKYEKFSEKYCIIEGIFDSALKRHWGGSSGGLKDIVKFNEWKLTRTKIKKFQTETTP